MSNLTDQNLTCGDCGQSFVWTAGEQEFYQQKGFSNAPRRCPECRSKKRAEENNRRGGERQMYKITCGSCGQEGEVPFQPRGDKPVLCRDCFGKQRKS